MAIDPVVIEFASAGVANVTKAFATVGQQLAAFEERSVRGALQSSTKRIKTAKDETREINKAHVQLTQDMDRLRVQGERHAERAAKTAARYAQQASREEIRAAENTSKELLRIAERTAQQRASILSRGAQGMGRAAGRAMSLAGSIAGLGGGLFLADTARKELSDEKVAQQILNVTTLGAGGVRPEGASMKSILGRAGQVAGETGISRDVILQTMSTYATNARGGNYEGMTKNIGFFAKLANVSGADINEIAGSAAQLQGQNPELGNPEKMKQMLATIYAQSAVGGTSFKNIIPQIADITSARGYFTGDETEAQKKLLALAQISVTGGAQGSVGTYMRSTAEQMGAHRFGHGKHAGLEAMGVKFNKDTGQIEDLFQGIAATFKGTGGDLSKIHEIFGKKSIEPFLELHKTYEAAGGGQKGMDATMAMMNSVLNAPGGTEEAINKTSAETMQTPAAKISAATEKIRVSIEEKMAPALERFADTISKPEVQKAVEGFIYSLETVVEWVTKHLGLTAGLVVGSKVAGSVAPVIAPSLVKGAMGLGGTIAGLLGGGGGAAAAGAGGRGFGTEMLGGVGMLGTMALTQFSGGIAGGAGALMGYAPARHFIENAMDSSKDWSGGRKGYQQAEWIGEGNSVLPSLYGSGVDRTHMGQGPMGLLGIGEGGANPFANIHEKVKHKSPAENMAALAKTVTDLNTPFQTLTQKVTDMATAAEKASKALGTIQGGNGGGVIPSPGGGESLSHGNLGAPGASS
jgi:hypothetical protein